MIPVDPASIDSRAARAAAAVDARGIVEGQLAMLTRLAEIGMELAEACGREAKAPPPEAPLNSPKDARPDPGPNTGITFARVARAVRMTIALQSRLLKDLAALGREDDLAERARKGDRRIRLSRLAGQAARAGVTARLQSGAGFWSDEDAVEDEIEQLSCEAFERLVDAEDGDLWGRSFDEVVAGIAKDLGLTPDWTARFSVAARALQRPGGEVLGRPSPAIPVPLSPDDPATGLAAPESDPPPPGPVWTRPSAPPPPPP